MHEATTHDHPPDELLHSEAAVMTMLLGAGHPWPWSQEEIARELGDQVRALTAVAALHGAGVVHCFGEFVFPARAATRMEEVRAARHPTTRERSRGVEP